MANDSLATISVKIPLSIRNMSKKMRTGLTKGLTRVALEIENEIKKLPQSDSFVDRTTNLRNSIRTEKPTETNLEASIYVPARIEYGAAVNDGTRTKSGKQAIRPRQYMQKGHRKVEPRMKAIILSALRGL